MAITEELKAKARAFARQLCAEMGEVSASEDECWLLIVEEMATEMGDAVATALVEEHSTTQPRGEEETCPQCGAPGRYRGLRERELVTRRGPATIHEPEYYCTCCRKSFFPDDAIDRG
jgi:hypothetical protein